MDVPLAAHSPAVGLASFVCSAYVTAAASIPRKFRKKTYMDELMTRIERKIGKVAIAGRFHGDAENIEDAYDLTKTVLGTGCCGEVRLAYGRGSKSHMKFAVKTFDVYALGKETRQDLESEIEILFTIDHPNIVRLVDLYDTGGQVHLVTECLEGGELFDRLRERKKFPEQEAAEAVQQMLLAVGYLHNLGIVHRDLKLENFMFDAEGSGRLVLIDFGLSQFWDPNTRMSSTCGTYSYVAPEVLHHSYTSQCDLWSLGVIAFAVLSGHMPFKGSKDEQTDAIVEGRYTFKDSEWEHVSDDGRNFMQSLLKVDESQRLTAAQAMHHRWIAQRSGARVAGHVAVDVSVARCLRDFGRASKFRRACLAMMSSLLTRDERAKVQQYFLDADVSKVGTLSLNALRMMMRNLDIKDAEVQHVCQTLDTSKAGCIRYTDFLAAMLSTHIPMHESLLRAAFDRFDVSHSGYITASNLRQALGDTFDGIEVKQLLSEIISTRNGKLSYAEFAAYLDCDKFGEPSSRQIGHDGCDSSTSGKFGAMMMGAILGGNYAKRCYA